MDVQQEILQDSYLNQKYEFLSKLGEGCFGQIYKVKNRQLNSINALKIEINTSNSSKLMLHNEAQILKRIQGKPFVPKFHGYGSWSMGKYLQIELLTKDFNETFLEKTFSIDEIHILTIKLFQALSSLHSCDIIHQDIKPQNIMFNQKGEINFIDFGISKRLKSENYAEEMKRTIRGFIGTPRYASLAAHCYEVQSKKDDLESLLYIIAYLYLKKLPWLSLKVSGCKKIEAIKVIKSNTAGEVFEKMGRPFKTAYEYVRTLLPFEDPNYQYLIGLFKRSSTMLNFQIQAKQRQKVDIRAKAAKRTSENLKDNYLQIPGFLNDLQKIKKRTTQLSSSVKSPESEKVFHMEKSPLVCSDSKQYNKPHRNSFMSTENQQHRGKRSASKNSLCVSGKSVQKSEADHSMVRSNMISINVFNEVDCLTNDEINSNSKSDSSQSKSKSRSKLENGRKMPKKSSKSIDSQKQNRKRGDRKVQVKKQNRNSVTSKKCQDQNDDTLMDLKEDTAELSCKLPDIGKYLKTMQLKNPFLDSSI